MLENYMKKIESLIIPNNYSRSNFKDKITTDTIDSQPQLLYVIKTEENANCPKIKDETSPQVDQSIKEEKEKLLKKRIETEGKLESPEEIKVNSSKSVQSAFSNTKKSLKSQNCDGDTKTLLDKIHNLNLKNMTYRNDIEKYKNKINQLTQEVENQKKLIVKYEAEKESNIQYLFKLEHMLNNNNNNNKKNAINSNSSNTICNIINNQTSKQFKSDIDDLPISISNDNRSNHKLDNDQSEQNSVKGNKSIFTESNFSIDVNKNNFIVIDDKKTKEKFTLSSSTDIKEFIHKLYKENQKLKIFQKQVFEISKSYDDINDNLHESIVKIQEIVNCHNDGQSNSSSIENQLLENYKQLVNNVNSTLQTKQNEYNLLLQNKDDHLALIQDELLILSKEIDERKQDRTKEIQIITNLEEEVRSLKEKLSEYGYNPSNSNNNNKRDSGFINRLKQNPNVKIEKNLEMAKNTLSNIVKHIETNLDMKDQSNAKMLGSISKVIK